MARPVKPCVRCGAPRVPGQRVQVDGKKVPACADCAISPWPAKYPKDGRRGSGQPYRSATTGNVAGVAGPEGSATVGDVEVANRSGGA